MDEEETITFKMRTEEVIKLLRFGYSQLSDETKMELHIQNIIKRDEQK